MTGKIIKGIAGFYYVHDGVSKVYECKAKGVFRNRKIKPLVGDNVEFDVLSEEECLGNIVEILPRENSLIRPAVANIDQAMIVFAVADPEPNLNLLDRFLVTMEAQDVPVVICFNKTDLGKRERLTGLLKSTGTQDMKFTYPALLREKGSRRSTIFSGERRQLLPVHPVSGNRP